MFAYRPIRLRGGAEGEVGRGFVEMQAYLLDSVLISLFFLLLLLAHCLHALIFAFFFLLTAF